MKFFVRLVAFVLVLVMMFAMTSPVFADLFAFVTVDEKEPVVLRTEGDGYAISVSCGPGSGIPEDAVLTAAELTDYPCDPEIPAGMEVVFSRFFDMAILSAAGEKLQPSSPVRVSVELTEASAESVEVLHFAEQPVADGIKSVKRSFANKSGLLRAQADEADPSPLSRGESVRAEISGSVISFDAGGFSVYAVLGLKTIEKQYIASSGETYDITVSYGPDAGIPEGADVAVTEIGADASDYDALVSDTEEALGLGTGGAEDIRLFDIGIVDASGREVTIAAPVQVEIRLADRTYTADPCVVHFGDETEILDTTVEDGAVRFEANGFSVYAIVSLDDLNGRSCGILNTQGGKNPKGIAMMAKPDDSGTKLTGKSTTVRVDPVGRTENVYVAENSNITMWTIQPAGDDLYHVTTEVNGSLKYLKITGAGVSLVDPEESSKLTVTRGTGSNLGKYRFSNDKGVLNLNGKTNTFERASTSENESGVWMSLAERSTLNDDDFVVYTAEKVSISGTVDETGTVDYDVKNGDQVVIYTRIWNETDLRYDYYAIDYDGKLIKAYESGDTISWVGSKVNTMLWDFTEYYYEGTTTPNHYYELQNTYSGKYIAPQVSGDGFLSDNTIGINLNGRRYNEYYSTILAWDDPYYDYASLKVRNYQLISAPMSKADDFYFAKMTVQETSQTPTPVATLDHTAYGITLKMQDYENINSSNRSQTQVDVLGNTQYNQWTGSPGLLKKNMTGDYPDVINTMRSLSELYSKAVTVNQQFLLSTYKETGYFEYDSTQNFAHLISSTDDYWCDKPRPGGGTYTVGDFVVYNELGTSNEGNKDTLKHGQFLPYNDLMVKNSAGEWVPRSYSTKYVNEMDISANPLSSLDPRKGERLYNIPYSQGRTAPDYVDHFFGMEMSARFMQSESGLDAWGHDLIFEFSGDDDFWLYIDGMLVLDLGGIHSALSASINFRTGEVIVNGNPTNLRALYKEAYLENHPGASRDEINAWLNEIFKDDGSNTGTVFKDYTGHSMRMFYMERGAGASNLHMRFNLAPYKDGEVLLEKEVSGTDQVDVDFPFQIYYKDRNDPADRFVLFTDAAKVVDYQTGERIPYAETYTVDGLTYEHVFFLRHGQTASIALPDEETAYYIKECAIDTDTFDWVKANEERLNGETIPDSENRKDYPIEESTVAGRKKVIYENHVSQNALKSLTIMKRLWQDDNKTEEIFSGTAPEADNTEFRFRVSIGNAVYNTGKYYVKDPEGYYCIYENGGFASTGKSVFSDLSTEVPEGEWKSERDKATFYASPGGAIDKIRAGYSVEIPDLIAGTAFLIEERSDEIPAGYKLLGYTLTNGPYSADNPGAAGNSGTISADNQTVSVHNQHGYGLIVNKIWSDAPFMASHNDLYFAVYLGESEEPLEGSVRRMRDPATSLRWFFPRLEDGKTLNDYRVYEVELTGVTVDETTGIVTWYDTITRKQETETIDVGGETNEHGYSVTYTYTVSYNREMLTAEQIAGNANARTDTVTNARPGLRLVKTDMSEVPKPLAGAIFRLTSTENNSYTKTFSSDENGLIAVAYLRAGTDYTLTEITAPSGYQAVIDPLTIRVDAENTVYVNGYNTDGEFYTITQVPHPTASEMPTVTIKNKDASLQAVKYDASTGRPMAGVIFSLYQEVTEFETGNPMPDYTPLTGYDSLETDENGVIPKIVLKNAANPNGLRPGTYYLRENTVSSAYDPLGYDIQITIPPTGSIELHKAIRPTQSGSWRFENLAESDLVHLIIEDSGAVTIQIDNKPKDPVRIKKLETGTTDHTLEHVEFALYKIEQIENGLPKEGAIPLVTGETDENGILNLGGLEVSMTYYLFETETLDGYMLLSAPVIITRTENSVKASLNGTSLTCKKVEVNGENVWEITVYNSTGAELPATGSRLTAVFPAAGAILAALAGVVLYGRKKRESL